LVLLRFFLQPGSNLYQFLFSKESALDLYFSGKLLSQCPYPPTQPKKKHTLLFFLIDFSRSTLSILSKIALPIPSSRSTSLSDPPFCPPPKALRQICSSFFASYGLLNLSGASIVFFPLVLKLVDVSPFLFFPSCVNAMTIPFFIWGRSVFEVPRGLFQYTLSVEAGVAL